MTGTRQADRKAPGFEPPDGHEGTPGRFAACRGAGTGRFLAETGLPPARRAPALHVTHHQEACEMNGSPVPVCVVCPRCWGDGRTLRSRMLSMCGACAGQGRIGRCPPPPDMSIEQIAELVDGADMPQEWKDSIVGRFERLERAFTARLAP